MDIVAASRDYCDLIDHAGSYQQTEFALAAVQRLSALVAAAAGMPPVATTDDELDEDAPDVSHQEWSERLEVIQAVLVDWDAYWSVEPTGLARDGASPEPTLGSVSDGLADTWRDVVAGLRWIDSGGNSASAVWKWRFGFHAHWAFTLQTL